jgi:hypothetical protein
MKVKCQRRHYDSEHILLNISQEIHEVTIVYYADMLNSWWVKLTPGVTGCESISIVDLMRVQPGCGWFACAGTPGSWAELYVLPDEMDRIREAILLVETLKTLKKHPTTYEHIHQSL